MELASAPGVPGHHRSARALLVTEADYANLSLLESPKLRRRLAAATRISRDAVPEHLITMNSIVRYRDPASGERGETQIVYPDDARSRMRNRCSVLSAPGLALLGASAGDVVEFGTGAAKRRWCIEEVLHQPESSMQKYVVVRD